MSDCQEAMDAYKEAMGAYKEAETSVHSDLVEFVRGMKPMVEIVKSEYQAPERQIAAEKNIVFLWNSFLDYLLKSSNIEAAETQEETKAMLEEQDDPRYQICADGLARRLHTE